MVSRTFTFPTPTTFRSENGRSSASMRRPSKTNLFKAFMRLNSISSRKDFLCFGSQMELELNCTGLGWVSWLRLAWVGSTVCCHKHFFSVTFAVCPGVYFHHTHSHFWPWSARSCSKLPCSYANPTAFATPIPGTDDSGRAMHIQLTFQLKSLCKAAATKGAPTKRKASKVRTSSKPELSAVQTPGSSDQ